MIRPCRSCRKPVEWKKLNGRPHPYDVDGAGVSHFATCPDAAEWDRRKVLDREQKERAAQMQPPLL